MRTTYYKCYEDDISSIAAGVTYSTASDAVEVQDVETVAVQVYAEGGNASISGDVVVTLAASVDGSNFDSQAFAAVTLTKSGTDQERATGLVNVRGVHSLRVLSVKNTDSSYAVENVNVLVGKTVV